MFQIRYHILASAKCKQRILQGESKTKQSTFLFFFLFSSNIQ